MRKVIFILLAITLFITCSEYPEDTEILNVSEKVIKSQFPSDNNVISIGPINATSQTVILLKTNIPNINIDEIHWYINGDKDESLKGFRLTPGYLKKGDVVQAVIIDGDKEYKSNEITIKNTPPLIVKARLLPSIPTVSSTLKVKVEANDADRDNISFKYKWYINNTFIGEDSFLNTELKRGDIIEVEVTPFDGEDPGRSIRLKSEVYNSLPVITESKPYFDGKTYRYQVVASDPDEDVLTFKLDKAPDGMTIDPSSGTITWEVHPDDKGEHEINVIVSDNNGGEVLVPITVTIQ
jgi:hypothetical protein